MRCKRRIGERRRGEKNPCKRRLKGIRLVFGNTCIKRYIPRVFRDFCRPLTIKCNADHPRMYERVSMCELRKVPIVVTATHADSCTTFIECAEWRYNQIDVSRADFMACCRFQKTVSIVAKLCIRFEFHKRHARIFFYHRRNNALVCAPTAQNDFTGIHFVP